MRIELYCACGNIAEGDIDSAAAEYLHLIWEAEHNSPSCKPCSRQDAIAAMAPEYRPPEAA